MVCRILDGLAFSQVNRVKNLIYVREKPRFIYRILSQFSPENNDTLRHRRGRIDNGSWSTNLGWTLTDEEGRTERDASVIEQLA